MLPYTYLSTSTQASKRRVYYDWRLPNAWGYQPAVKLHEKTKLNTVILTSASLLPGTLLHSNARLADYQYNVRQRNAKNGCNGNSFLGVSCLPT